MKEKHEIKLDRTVVSVCRWMFSFTLNEMKTNTERAENYWDWTHTHSGTPLYGLLSMKLDLTCSTSFHIHTHPVTNDHHPYMQHLQSL